MNTPFSGPRPLRHWVAGLLTVLAATAVAATARAQNPTNYVTDQFEVTMRRAPSAGNTAIVRVLRSGTPLVVLERDAGNGWSRVRLTTSDTEGYVLTRYLMSEPDARSQLASLRERVDTLRNESGDQGRELDDLRQASAESARRIAALDQENQRLEIELSDLQAKAANVISIDRENTSLRKELTDTQIVLEALQQENDELSSRRIMHWFLIGAAVLLAGVVVGLVLPGLRRRKRGGYGSGDLL
ncbi:MAG: TIGR04211 family SH3 domain-containing protein [Pseudomonadota bacterium]